ncbi:MAG: 50S ribosomal protein L25 [Planctomycetota bacterium]|nr:MAG: 50S ribosomal protein L25 [Planctomycetota bacterium]
MSTAHPITAEPREKTGSRHCRRLREAGRLPAVLYGHKKPPAHLSLDAREALAHIRAGEKVYEIRLGGAAETALLKDLSYDHLGARILHADFERVDLSEEVTVNVHLHLVGEAAGLKHAGAMLVQSQTELAVRCAVRDLKDAIDVDVSALDVGGALHAGDVPLPAGWTLAQEADAVLATIQIAKKEAEGEAVEAEAGEAEPEVIAEVKDEGEGEAKAESKE